mmetsp:Transcript_12276/g.18539  ORF Transcript_12276/g.18539 Transcript_12276/m.18539 type:complete len:107 (-) Transcript_12276:361-681(-)
MIRAQIGMECNAYVLESIEKGKKTAPGKPTAVTKNDGSMTRPKEMKFKERYSRYLIQIKNIDSQLKQCYYKYHGQCDSNMNALLEEDPGFKEAHQNKDVIELISIL